MIKLCNCCKILKNSEEFAKNRRFKDGLQYKCKKCYNEIYKNNINKLLKYSNEYNTDNKLARKEWNKKNKIKIKEYHLLHYAKNNTIYKKQHKNWRDKNNEWLKEYSNNKYNNDINFKIKHLIRSEISHSLKHNKTKKSVEYLGCSYQECREYLEKQFKPEMTW